MAGTQDRNVAGILRGRGGLAARFVIVGAHFDHLGRVEPVSGSAPLPGPDQYQPARTSPLARQCRAPLTHPPRRSPCCALCCGGDAQPARYVIWLHAQDGSNGTNSNVAVVRSNTIAGFVPVFTTTVQCVHHPMHATGPAPTPRHTYTKLAPCAVWHVPWYTAGRPHRAHTVRRVLRAACCLRVLLARVHRRGHVLGGEGRLAHNSPGRSHRCQHGPCRCVGFFGLLQAVRVGRVLLRRRTHLQGQLRLHRRGRTKLLCPRHGSLHPPSHPVCSAKPPLSI